MTSRRLLLGLSACGLLVCTPRLAWTQSTKPNQCATCHSGLPDPKLSAPPHAVVGDVHDKAGVHCADCHGGDASASDKTAAHSTAKGYRGTPHAAEICASCHVLIAERFKGSVHAQIFDKACVECHSNHGIKAPSDALVGTAKGTLCETCHNDKDDPGFTAANAMHSSLDRINQGITGSTASIDGLRNAGMEVGDQELALTDAKTKLVLARTELHAFDPKTLDGVVADGMKVLDGVDKAAARGQADLTFRRRGLFAALAVILLFVLALGLKIRELNRSAA